LIRFLSKIFIKSTICCVYKIKMYHEDNKMKKLIIAFSIAMSPTLAYSASCADYPLSEGMSIEDVNGGTKFMSTSFASVDFDDIDSVRDARDEATMLAKAEIVKFINQGMQSDETIDRVVGSSTTTNNAGKTVTKEEMVKRLKSLRNSASGLLRGVVVLGDCYTKGEQVGVTVGIKPETIASAGNLDRNIQQSIQESTNGVAQGIQGGDATTELKGVEGFSNSSRLNNF
jgi:hypothetical protein